MTDNHSIRFQDFGISEEILGAYLEGNLTDYEHSFVETILQSDDGLKEFISEVTNDFIYKSNAFDEEISMNFNSFQLPEISGTDPINTDSDVSSFNYQWSEEPDAPDSCMPTHDDYSFPFTDNSHSSNWNSDSQPDPLFGTGDPGSFNDNEL